MHWPTRWPPIVNIVFILTAIAIFLLAAMLAWSRSNRAPEQPIPFSHRLHASEKQINCFFCHPYPGVSASAGIPPVEKCLLCHNVIASDFTPVSKIHEYNRKHESIPWVRVYKVPEYVHFNHRCHIAGGHDCSDCHGDVKGMDRITPVKRINMNFCITCHRQNKVPVDCYICHY